MSNLHLILTCCIIHLLSCYTETRKQTKSSIIEIFFSKSNSESDIKEAVTRQYLLEETFVEFWTLLSTVSTAYRCKQLSCIRIFLLHHSVHHFFIHEIQLRVFNRVISICFLVSTNAICF